MCMIQGYCISALGQNFFYEFLTVKISCGALVHICTMIFPPIFQDRAVPKSCQTIPHYEWSNMYFHFFLHIYEPLEFDLR